ncbi:MAG: hypothetical protein RTU09_10420 [Candidatus Thorarchaeota archaeon]
MSDKGYKPTAAIPSVKNKPKSLSGVKSVPMDNAFRAEIDVGNADIQKGTGSGKASKTMNGVVAHLNSKVKTGGKPK